MLNRQAPRDNSKADNGQSHIEIPCIRIPTLTDEIIQVFPDELPVSGNLDYNDMVDLLRSEMAPLDVWRQCAVEYHRQGFSFEFNAVLNEIVESILDAQLASKYYSGSKDFNENMTDIFHALAAKHICEMGANKESNDEAAARAVECIRKADSYATRMNEYTWLLRGFFELKQGDIKRAEDQFKTALERAVKMHGKKKYSFVSFIGMGIVSFIQQSYQTALDYFGKAIKCSPNCGANVRVAYAVCCFRLEQYERARSAVERSLALDPCNSNALILLALLKQAEAKKSVGVTADHANRMECRMQAYEYCVLVSAIDPSSSMALVHIANDCAHAWKPLLYPKQPPESRATLLDDGRSILVKRAEAKDIAVGDQIRINFSPTYLSVAAIDTSGSADSLTIVLDSPIAAVDDPSQLTIEIKEFGRAFKLALEAIQHTSDSELKAEAYYIMGKVHHMQSRAELALACYRKSLGESEFMLSAFGAAQIQLSKQELPSAYDLFERVHQKYPNDKDTRAYFALIKALHKKEATPMEQLKDICIGFQFEADLWMLQGQLRFDQPNEFPAALKCLMNSLECTEKSGKTPDSLLLSNIAVLNHGLGRYNTAVDYGKRSLIALEKELTADSSMLTGNRQQNPLFKSYELDGVLYSWKDLSRQVTFDGVQGSGRFVFVDDDASMSSSSSSSESEPISELFVGADVVISDVLHKVTAVHSANSFSASSFVPLSAATANGTSSSSGDSYPIKVKQLWHNFTDNEITLSYNFARMLEDTGATSASVEIYVELLKRHPSYMECYLRLSRISRDMGRFDEASMWLSRALAINDADPDVNVCLGDLYAKNSMWDDAKKVYEKICNQKYHDNRAMLSLGNFYFTTLSSRDSKYESHLKDSYKFFFHVLNEDHKNVYAANGLGMVCAEKKEFDVANQIFAKAKESKMSALDDICINLAHVHYSQGQFVKAEHQYVATMKSIHGDKNVVAAKLATLCEYVAQAQHSNKRFDDSIRSLLRAIHYLPFNLRLWFRIAAVRSDISNQYINKHGRTTEDIQIASEQLSLSQNLFLFLASTSIQISGKESHYDRESAMRHAKICEGNKSVYMSYWEEAQRVKETQDEARRRQEAEHQERRRAKEEERERAARAVEESRLEKQQIALQKARKLDEMREKWVAVPTSDGAGPKKGKGKGLKGLKGGATDDDDMNSDSDIDQMIAAAKKGDTNVNDMFGSDDDDNAEGSDDDQGNSRKRKDNGDRDVADSDGEGSQAATNAVDVSAKKRIRKSNDADTADDDDDELLIEDEVGAPTADGAVASNGGYAKLLIDDDEDM